MNPLRRLSWPRAILFASIVGAMLMLSACGSSGGSGDSSATPAPSQAGALSLSLEWDQSGLHKPASKSQASWMAPLADGDVCSNYLIEEIQAKVFDSSGAQVASATWPCSDHSGQIDEVPAGSNISIVVDGFVASGLAWSGQLGDIVVRPGEITQAGKVTMRYRGNDTEPPEILSTTPSDGAEAVPLTSLIAVVFSEEMVIATMVAANFACVEVISQTPVSGQVGYDPATRTLTFTPDTPFNGLTEYRATVAAAVEDLAGHPMQADYSWNFYTTFLDSDGDGMPDDWEEAYGLNPFVNDAKEDRDEDGLDNLTEYLRQTLPNNRDSDGDGYNDGREVLQATNPNDNVSFLGIPDIEVAALQALYTSTKGESWYSNDNWMGAIGTECSWLGVTCDAAGNHVTRLNLPGNNLDGPLPAAIGDLSSLDRLDLGGGIESRNYLSGAIPEAIGNLANLTYLSLDRNQISGPVPPAIGSLTQLRTLDLSYNQLSEPIPAAIGNLSALQTLYLQQNQITGPIPEELGDLANLVALNLGSNELSGSIPDEIGGMANLEELDLSRNKLTGLIPGDVGTLVKLRTIDLSGGLEEDGGKLVLGFNQLSGSIPDAIGNLAALQRLDLGYNQLENSIPGAIGNLVNLQYLDLGFNKLGGFIPPEIGNLSTLRNLYLNSNQLVGEIPLDLLKLQGNLEALYIGYNALYTGYSQDYDAFRNFLNGVASGWDEIQTIAPDGLWVSSASDTSVTFNWETVGNQPGPGGYKVEFKKSEEVQFSDSVRVASKDSSTVTVDGLDTDTCYSFRIKTVTDPYDAINNPSAFNQNTVTSDDIYWEGEGQEFISNEIRVYTSEYWYYYSCYED
jgi:hypothetical protein